MKLITENINASPDENDIIDELTSIIGKWGDNVEKQDILNLINNYTDNKSLDETVRGFGTGYAVESMEDSMFFIIVKLLVEEHELDVWEEMSAYDTHLIDERLQNIHNITKLFGRKYQDSGHPASMASKLFWAVIDNHEDIESGDLDEFKYLTLRPLTTFNIGLEEDISETNTYTWDVSVDGYNDEDVTGYVLNDSEGHYSPYDYDYDMEHIETNRPGMVINDIKGTIVSESINLNEESPIPSVGDDYVIGRIDVAIMDRIVRDYSVTEIQEFVKKMWFDLEVLDDTLKWFGKKGELKLVKKYVQFIWDNGVPEDFTPFIGQKLPRMKMFKFTYRWERQEIESFNGDIVVYGTDYETTRCEVKRGMWEYEMQEIRSTGILREDDDLHELMSVSVDGDEVFNVVTPDKWDKKYDIRKSC